jgi:hypothetical protein
MLWEIVFPAGALFTLALEISLPFLIWNRRWRGWMICGAVALHVGIAMMMGLIGFSLLMITILASFLSASAVRRALALVLQSRSRFWLGYSRAAGQARAAAAVRAFDVWGQIEVVDLTNRKQLESNKALPDFTSPGRIQLIETDSHEIATGFAVFERLVRSLRQLWPLALLTWVPGVGALGRRFWPSSNSEPQRPRPRDKAPAAPQTTEV